MPKPKVELKVEPQVAKDVEVQSEAKEDTNQSFMSKPLSTKAFILSLIAIVLISLSGTFMLYKYLYENTPNPKDLKNYSPVSREPSSFSMEVTNPDDELLTFDKTLIISGRTSEKATIVISNNDTDTAIEANAQGDFSKVINLNKGLNEITINAFDSFGNNKTEVRTVYYSEEKL